MRVGRVISVEVLRITLMEGKQTWKDLNTFLLKKSGKPLQTRPTVDPNLLVMCIVELVESAQLAIFQLKYEGRTWELPEELSIALV